MVRLHDRYTAADTELAGALQPMLAVLEKSYAKQADAQKAHGDPAERGLTAPDAGGPPAVTDEAVVAAVERYRLTTRELEVVRLLCRGLTAHQMAQVLRISEGTTRKHLQNIYAKLGVHDRLLVAARVRSLGLDRSATPRS